jgi:hypothetical protein
MMKTKMFDYLSQQPKTTAGSNKPQDLELTSGSALLTVEHPEET